MCHKILTLWKKLLYNMDHWSAWFFFKKNGPTPASFAFIFGLFKQTVHFLQQINEKNIHPVYGTGIMNHDLSEMSRQPQPPDQGSHPWSALFINTSTQ